MTDNGWVASDSLVVRFHNQRPGGTSLLSVAVAVNDIDEFDEKYNKIIEGAINKYKIRMPFNILKNKDINRWVSDWDLDNARKDIATSLLDIETLETIQITETYFEPTWVNIYSDDDQSHERINAQDLLTDRLSSYYNLVSIWKYMDNGNRRPTDTRLNVLTDDFTGKYSKMWSELGEESNHLNIVPNGDQTYPLLSAADIIMAYLDQEVYPLFNKNIYEFLKEYYDGDGKSNTWIDADGVNMDSDYEFERMIPNRNETVRRTQHYPKPTVFIDRGDIGRKELESLDIMRYACKYAHQRRGCVKAFDHHEDKHFITEDDVLISLEGSKNDFDLYSRYNKDVDVVEKDVIGYFEDEID